MFTPYFPQSERLVTAEEFADMQRDLDLDNVRSELIAGHVRVSPLGSWEYGRIGGRLLGTLGVYAHERKLGVILNVTGFLTARNPDSVRAPDFAFIEKRREPRPYTDWWCTVMPDLAVDVRERDDSPAEFRSKAEMWLEVGVRLVWVVLPAPRAIEVYRLDQPVVTLGEGDALDGADVIPGFTEPVAAVFGPPRGTALL